MKCFSWFGIVLALGMGAGCDVGDDAEEGEGGASASPQNLVSPSDPDALTGVLVIPGSDRVSGSLPPPSTQPDAPTIEVQEPGTVEVQAGGAQARIPLSFSGANAYTDCLIQVPGADEYFQLPDASGATDGSLEIPVEVPDSVASGTFCVQVCIADDQGNYSNLQEQCFSITNPLEDLLGSAGSGGGALPPGTTFTGDVPQECQDLVGEFVMTGAGSCVDACVSDLFECVVENNCQTLPQTCLDQYLACFPPCVSAQQ